MGPTEIAQVAAAVVVAGLWARDELSKRRKAETTHALAEVSVPVHRCHLPQTFAENIERWQTPVDGLAPRTVCRCADPGEVLRISEVVARKVVDELEARGCLSHAASAKR